MRYCFASLAAAGALVFSQAFDQPAKARAWETLNHGLVSTDPAHRILAVTAFGTMGPLPAAVQAVERVLKEDKDTLVRQTAAATLGEMRSPEAIPALKAALDDNAEVSFTAAKALWQLGDTSGREIFQQVLKGERKDAPNMVQGALRKAKQKLHTPTELALMGVKEASGVLLGPASMGIKVGMESLKDKGASGRTLAVEMLAKDDDPYALTLLEWALADDSWVVRASVAKALGERGNQATIPKLMPLLAEDRHVVRYMAAASILRLSVKAGGAVGANPGR